jgi:transketolase
VKQKQETTLLGGSADLTGSNFTRTVSTNTLDKNDYSGRYVNYGIREFGMAAAMNGMALHGGIIPYGGTFLIFSDYCRAAIRLSALQETRVVYVMTHDSIGVGEDGPTHQPIEHLTALRAIPQLDIVRPADANETAEAWLEILKRKRNPAGIVLTRQNLPVVDRTKFAPASLTAKGGYVLSPVSNPEAVIIATGSEVQFALEAQAELAASGIQVNVVSMPCVEWFKEQPKSYQDEVLPPSLKARVSVEAGLTMGWREFVGDQGVSVGIDHYGASADYQTLYREFGITTEAVIAAVKTSIAGK